MKILAWYTFIVFVFNYLLIIREDGAKTTVYDGTFKLMATILYAPIIIFLCKYLF